MARDGSGVYSKPSGTTAVPLATVESVKYNSTIDDLVTDANTARPIVAGGTGATSASAARVALGLEIGVDVEPAGGANAFLGFEFTYAGTSAPTGFLICDGSAISRTTYADLFAAIGTTWGVGDGSTTFNIPDRRDRYGRGSSGTYTAGTYLSGQNAAHTHGPGSLSGYTNTTGNHSHTPQGGGSFRTTTTGNGPSITSATTTYASTSSTNTTGNHSHTAYINGGATASSGGTETRPNSNVYTVCIKY